jgi:hypothetical protein
MSLLQKIKKFYVRSPENRMQFFEILGFIVVPIVCLAILFIVMIRIFH